MAIVSSCQAVDIFSVTLANLTETTMDYSANLLIDDLIIASQLSEAECNAGDPAILSTAAGSNTAIGT